MGPNSSQESGKQDVLFICFSTKIPIDSALESPALDSSDNTFSMNCKKIQSSKPASTGNKLKSLKEKKDLQLINSNHQSFID